MLVAVVDSAELLCRHMQRCMCRVNTHALGGTGASVAAQGVCSLWRAQPSPCARSGSTSATRAINAPQRCRKLALGEVPTRAVHYITSRFYCKHILLINTVRPFLLSRRPYSDG